MALSSIPKSKYDKNRPVIIFAFFLLIQTANLQDFITTEANFVKPATTIFQFQNNLRHILEFKRQTIFFGTFMS